jgi:hypothetical protein
MTDQSTNGHGEEFQGRIAGYMQDIIDKIAEHGWMAISVMAGEDGDNPFTYTVGLADYDVELVVAGLDPVRAHGVLGAARKAIIDGTVILDPAREQVQSTDVLAPRAVPNADAPAELPVSFNRITAKENAPVNVAHMLEDHREWTLWQIVWPDAAGLLPDHPDYDLTLLRSQILPGR